MTVALTYLAWTIALSVFQILFTAAAKRRQDGYHWAAGNRDNTPRHYTGLASRMVRAQVNLLETLPAFIGAVLIAHAAGQESSLTAWGAGLFFWSRLIYIPAYAFGWSPWRSMIWFAAMAGLALVLLSLV